ncbi:cytochrome c4 [Deinococcus psychrotolerans]|uniref:Cytochrome c4 n=2 Tax=Deinococcus TaxID=1298 RepID=A0A553V5M9_9DEIO|nr:MULTISPECIES: cytochrome c4 [Deinococcus]AZI42982.1 cytochrome c4 [Deinococcus psychrotolerans]TSA87773.1 cytochrome c4 [Deinococcus detaillensis]
MSRLPRAAFWLPVLTLSALAVGLSTAHSQSTNAPPAGDPLAIKAGPPNAQRGETLTKSCQGCHGPMGHSTESDKPSLGGQIPSYTTLQLAAFRAKLRPSQIMQAIAANLSDQDIVDLAAYYAQQTPRGAWDANAALKAKGEQIYDNGIVGRNVTACVVCHGANGRGSNYLHVASITHQSPKYTLEVLNEFKSVPDYKLAYPNAMHIVTAQMTDDELSAVTAYLSSMGAGK